MTNIEKYNDAHIVTNMGDELVCNSNDIPVLLKLEKENIDRFLLEAEKYDKNLNEDYTKHYELPLEIDSSKYIKFSDGGLDIGRFFPTVQDHIQWLGGDEISAKDFIEQFNSLNIIEF